MRKSIVSLLGLGLVAGSVMSAQAAEGSKPWAVSVGLGGVYDDNRDGLSTNKESNFDFILEPRVDFKVQPENSFMDFFYSPSLRWRSNPRETSSGSPQNDSDVYHTAGIDLRHAFSDRSLVKLNDTFAYTDDPAISDYGLTIRENETHFRSNLNAGLDMGLTDSTIWTAGAKTGMKRYDNETVARRGDEDNYGAETALGKEFGDGMKAIGHVGFDTYAWDSDQVDRGVDIYTADGGLERTLSEELTLHGALGYQAGKFDSNAQDDMATVYANLGGVLSGAETRLKVDAIYGLAAADVLPYSAQERAQLKVQLERDVTERVMVAAFGRVAQGKYDSFYENGLNFAGGTEKLLEAGLSTDIKLSNIFSLDLGYKHEKWDSDETLRESFDRNLFSAMLKASI